MGRPGPIRGRTALVGARHGSRPCGRQAALTGLHSRESLSFQLALWVRGLAQTLQGGIVLLRQSARLAKAGVCEVTMSGLASLTLHGDLAATWRRVLTDNGLTVEEGEKEKGAETSVPKRVSAIGWRIGNGN